MKRSNAKRKPGMEGEYRSLLVICSDFSSAPAYAATTGNPPRLNIHLTSLHSSSLIISNPRILAISIESLRAARKKSDNNSINNKLSLRSFRCLAAMGMILASRFSNNFTFHAFREISKGIYFLLSNVLSKKRRALGLEYIIMHACLNAHDVSKIINIYRVLIVDKRDTNYIHATNI